MKKVIAIIMGIFVHASLSAQSVDKMDLYVSREVGAETPFDINHTYFDRGALGGIDTVVVKEQDSILALKKTMDSLIEFTDWKVKSQDTRGKVVFYQNEQRVDSVYFCMFYLFKDSTYYRLSPQFKKMINDIYYKRKGIRPYGYPPRK